MIRRLRSRHRWMWTVLAPLLALLLWAALGARPGEPPPVAGELFAPDGSTRATPTTVGPWHEANGLRARPVRLLPDNGPAVELELGASIQGPDLLVYWVHGPVAEEATLLGDAWLLGEAPREGARTYALPPGARDGTVVIHSLAHRSHRATLGLSTGGG